MPYLQTAATKTGKTVLSDVFFEMPDSNDATTGYALSYLSAIDWQAGQSSVVNQIALNLDYYDGTDVTSAARKLITVEKTGGGKWYGVQASVYADAVRAQNPGFRFLYVNATTAPLTFYGPNFEHAQTSTFVEVANAHNVRVYATKTENNDSWEWVDSSANVQLAGLSGDWHPDNPPNVGILVNDSSNVLLSGLGWYSNESNASAMVSTSGVMLPDASVPYADGVSIFENGAFVESPFPHCGDGYCDGAETAALCPSDCGPGADAGVDAGYDGGTGPRTTACKTPGGPPVWSKVSSFFIPYTDAVILSNAPTAPSSNEALSATVQTAWDSANLYVHVAVTQASIVLSPNALLYYSDAVELYLDGTDSRLASYGADDYQVVVTADNRVSPTIETATQLTHTTARTAAGYTVDVAIPFTSLGTTSGHLGFDVAIDANDSGGMSRTSQLMWSGNGLAYEDPQQFGQLALSNEECGVDAGVVVGGGSGPGAGVRDGGGVDGGARASSSSGCGCSVVKDASAGTTGLAALFAPVLLMLRRRRAGARVLSAAGALALAGCSSSSAPVTPGHDAGVDAFTAPKHDAAPDAKSTAHDAHVVVTPDASDAPVDSPDGALVDDGSVLATRPTSPAVTPLFIGSGGFGFGVGSAFPGAAYPQGMAKVGPETSGPYGVQDFLHCSGYWYGDTTILGFSQMHLHGTGAQDYGILSLMPIPTWSPSATTEAGYGSPFAKSTETAVPGKYEVTLTNGNILVELTATPHAAHHRYTYPAGTTAGHVVLDIDHHLSGSVTTESVTLTPATNTITGSFRSLGGMSAGFGGYMVYFAAQTKAPWSNALVWSSTATPAAGTTASGVGVGVDLDFDLTASPGPIEVQVGLSLVSLAGAQENLASELPAFAFDTEAAATAAAWTTALSPVTFSGGTPAQQNQLTAALYHLFLMPSVLSDDDGSYIGLDGNVGMAADYHYVSDLSLWDTYRTLSPLYALIAPARALDTGEVADRDGRVCGLLPEVADRDG